MINLKQLFGHAEDMTRVSHPRVTVLPDIEMRAIERTSLNRLCDISDWRTSGALTNTFADLNEGSYIHRKSWEYAMCILGIAQLGALRPEARAIAVGARYERPLYYFANQIAEMVATDLYDNEAHEGKPSMLANPRQYAPFPYREEHMTVQRMDGTGLQCPGDTFDFSFSLSLIEHFGSKANSQKAVEEMARVTKPGGIVCISTELILNRATHPEFFTYEQLFAHIIEVPGLRLVGGDLDLRISHSLMTHPIWLDKEARLDVSPHIVLRIGDVLFTSIMVFLQKQAQ